MRETSAFSYGDLSLSEDVMRLAWLSASTHGRGQVEGKVCFFVLTLNLFSRLLRFEFLLVEVYHSYTAAWAKRTDTSVVCVHAHIWIASPYSSTQKKALGQGLRPAMEDDG